MSSMPVLGILQVRGPGSVRDELPIWRPVLRFGRGGDSHVILNAPTVSNRHAQLSRDGDAWRLEDLGSRNHTYVNNQQLPAGRPIDVQPGDEVRVGPFRLEIRALRPDESPPPLLGETVHISEQLRPGLVVFLAGHLAKFPLGNDVATLGRAADNDIRIDHPCVSAHHARIEPAAGAHRIVDLDSLNGLTCQGRRVRELTLRDGDTLTIGQGVALRYLASIGFLPGRVKKEAEPPPEQYLDIPALARAGRPITIGRHSQNVVRLDHPRVSRFHALIERVGPRFQLRDLDSHNGTFVNGRRVQQTYIQEGDEIRIASYRLVFQERGSTRFINEVGHIRLDAISLEKWYSPKLNALQRVSFSIYPQEFVAVIGGSGAGKSTLLKALSGFSPANGRRSRVYVNGHNFYRHIDEYRNDMGYVPQEDIVHAELTAYEALDYAAQLRMPADTAKEERERRIREVLTELGLEKKADGPVIGQLSGGERKRVSLGVELLTKPGLFFVDEATSGLDAYHERETMRLLRNLADDGRTVVLNTHAPYHIGMCDQVLALAQGGYLAYYGPPEAALGYFDQYRSAEQQRQDGDIEFDDVLMLLETSKPAECRDWARRYMGSRQYDEFVKGRLKTLPQVREKGGAQKLAAGQHSQRPAPAWRQLVVLSARNLRIMARDKVGLAMMLAAAPLIGAMDFIWGRRLFDPTKGDAARIVTMMFMMALIAILVGALGAVREIVKENDIYKRERTVVLKLVPYLLSKIWVGTLLAAYQAAVFMVAKRSLVAPQLSGPGGYSAMYVTLFLCTLSGYMMGLAISAGAPNQNIALTLLLLVLVPQFLFAGGLLTLDTIPGGKTLSVLASSRWAFEALVRITGIGDDLSTDPCWQRPEKEWDDLAATDHPECPCMGPQMFDRCRFPGIQVYRDADAQAALGQPRPTPPPSPTPYPTPTPLATPRPRAAPSLATMKAYCDSVGQDARRYCQELGTQGQAYGQLLQQQGREYQAQNADYVQELLEWQTSRTKAVRSAVGMMKGIYKGFQTSFQGSVQSRWLNMAAIICTLFLLTLYLQKRKDVL